MPNEFYYSMPTATPSVAANCGNGIFTNCGDASTSSWMIANIIMISVLGGLLLYFLFVAKKNKFSGFLAKVHDFFAFRIFFIEAIMKILYIISVIFVTLVSLVLIPSEGVMSCLAFFLFGNLALRIGYELLMMFFNLVHDTAEIRRNTKDSGGSSRGSSRDTKASGGSATEKRTTRASDGSDGARGSDSSGAGAKKKGAKK